MKVADVPRSELARRLAHPGLSLDTGPFVVRFQSPLPSVVDAVWNLYEDFPLAPDDALVDFSIRIARPLSVRRWWHPHVLFFLDGAAKPELCAEPLAVPMLEWFLNSLALTHAHQYVMLHAAVVERDGRAAVLPGWPGSGKSTLCAALVHRGWRLLSDEFGLLRPGDTRLVPWPRPLSLKEASIDAVQRFTPAPRIGPIVEETSKGRVAQLRPPGDSVRRATEPAEPAWIVFPKYQDKAPTTVTPLTRSRAYMRLADNSPNVEHVGLPAFEALAAVIETTDAFELVYSDLDEAMQFFETLAPLAAASSRS
ncbi:MAG TPA: HprK-related kinase A [Gaiellales bacterium]|nr:HprK-related kinase A [Gaiellales bacterium]